VNNEKRIEERFERIEQNLKEASESIKSHSKSINFLLENQAQFDIKLNKLDEHLDTLTQRVDQLVTIATNMFRLFEKHIDDGHGGLQKD